MTNRAKVGKGNRRTVRNHFREFGIELMFGRKLANDGYSFKPSEGFRGYTGVNAEADRDREFNHLVQVAGMCPLPVKILKTVTDNGLGYKNYNTAIRFEDK